MHPQLLPKSLSVQWLMSATGSYSRAASSLATEIDNSNLEDAELCRNINDRIMSVRAFKCCRLRLCCCCWNWTAYGRVTVPSWGVNTF